MKYKFLSIILLFSIILNSQTIVEDGKIELNFVKSKAIAKHASRTAIIIKTDKLKTIFVKVKITSPSGKKEIIDVNKFYLIDELSNSRIKLIDVNYQKFTSYLGFDRLVDKKKSGKKKRTFLYEFNSSIQDTFYKFDKDGYKNVVLPINFGTIRKPDNQIIHFRPKKFKSQNLLLFFPFLKDSNNAILYYGDTKIQNFPIE